MNSVEGVVPVLALQHTYPAVERGGAVSYGGSQMFSPDPAVRRCGCGLVAALDMLLYLGRYRPGCAVDFLPWDGRPIPPERYEALLQSLRRRYLPLGYPFGINGLLLSAGLNRLFRAQRIPLSARWVWRRGELWPGLDRMLSDDLPVILAVGPNFPLLLSRKNLLPFCRFDGAGQLHPVTSTAAHYVTVTGRDREWLRCSSWGREYYLRTRDFTEYAERHSSYVFSNILKVEERER